jgi:predicted exporter
VRAFKTMLPPILAVVLTPLIISAFGEVFTLFNLMALILVFAVGLDYSLFLSHAQDERRGVALVANILSGLSTILAFGLLTFSELYAVHAFGVTLFCGILLSILFSMIPIVRMTTGKSPSAGNIAHDK